MPRRLERSLRRPGDANAFGVLLLVQIAFATLSVEGKVAMGAGVGVDATALAMARIAGGAAAFGAVVAVRRAASRSGAPGGLGNPGLLDAAKLAGLSLLGIVVNQWLFLRGLHDTSPLAATVLVATVPVFAAVISAALGRERLTPRTTLGLSLAVLGIAVLTRFHAPAGGDLLVLVNALSYAFYLVLAQTIILRLGALVVMTWIFGLGTILFAPLGGRALLLDAPRWSWTAAWLVGFIVLVPTIFAYLANAWALGRATPSQVAVFVYLQPIFVALLAFVQLGQPVEPRLVAAGGLILAGVTLVVRRR